VISTIPLGCLQTVGLDVPLSYNAKVAIRCASYMDSTKVGIKFKSRWWQNPPVSIVGGLTNTDRPTRCVVYPSYGINDPTAPAVMIASYNWSQDASRFGSLIQGHDSPTEHQIVFDIILRDFVELHNVPYDFLVDQYVDHFSWNWYHNEFSRGAFAFFGPGQFSELFPVITRPGANGKLHFAGEATSVHHAWVAGAISSAWRAVAEILILDGIPKEEVEKILVGKGFIKPDEVDMELVWKQIALAALNY